MYFEPDSRCIVSNHCVIAFLRRIIVRLLLHWILSALAVWIVANVVPGISVSGPVAALIAALVIGLVNATLGLLLKILTFPLTLLTLGLFWFVINALMLELAAYLVRGFQVRGFEAAFLGAIVLSVVSSLLQWMFMPRRRES
jgi:putative membrane protein